MSENMQALVCVIALTAMMALVMVYREDIMWGMGL